MQFPVPQFTEVEDKIIGPLTVKQFGIIFGAGVIIFGIFSLTKSVIVLVFVSLLVGLPALGLSFAKLNGRPIYNMLGNLIRFFNSPKLLVFHKQGSAVLPDDLKQSLGKKDEIIVQTEAAVTDPQQRIKDINRILEKKAEEERELFKK